MKINFDAPPTSAQETNGLEVRYAAAKRRVPRWRWYLLLAMVLGMWRPAVGVATDQHYPLARSG